MATSNSDGVPPMYYEEPFSLHDMDDRVHKGLLAIGILATMSVVFTSALLSFITWRMISWKSYYTSFIGRNQCIVLIYQLIFADLLQALGFLISFHWSAQRAIIGPDPVCFAQGWLIQLGDVASGFFVLAIALHTFSQVTLSRSLQHRYFMAVVVGLWVFSLVLTSLAPILGGRYVFTRAGSWCWISERHDGFRLGLHYLWISIVQFGSILIYTFGFYSIYRGKQSRNRMVQGASARALRRAASAMLLYACVYTILTLPLAAGRMSTMSGRTLSESFYLVAGCLFTSAGWVDTILYTLTRQSLLFHELDPHGDAHNDNQTVGGGGGGGPGSRDPSFHRASSTDSILGGNGDGNGGGGKFGGIKVDRTVNVEVVMDDLESKGSSSNRGSDSKSEAGFTAEAHAARTFG